MAYTTPGTKTNEIVRLQGEITSEISRDAPAIAVGIFGDNKNHPDMAQVSNQQLDDLYRAKYQSNDRAWLQAEAKRDPQQFLDVAKRIGVQAPSTAPGMPPPQAQGADLNKILSNNAQAAPAPAPAPGIPMALPAPPPGPAGGVALAVPPPPAPVILGPNGMPLQPSGAPIPAMT